MKSQIDFEPIIIEDLFLDEAGMKILTKMQLCLDKLLTYEISSPENRDNQMAIDLSKLLDGTESLKKRYMQGIEKKQSNTDAQIQILKDNIVQYSEINHE